MRVLRPALLLVAILGLSTLAGRTADAEVWLKSWDARGNPIQLRDLRGKVVAVTFGSRHVQDEITEVNDTLVAQAGDDFEVLCVVDMMDIPDVGRGTAKKRIADADKPGVLQHLVDDKGSLKRAFEADPRSRVDILLIDKRGELRGHFRGLNELEAATKKVQELRAE